MVCCMSFGGVGGLVEFTEHSRSGEHSKIVRKENVWKVY